MLAMRGLLRPLLAAVFALLALCAQAEPWPDVRLPDGVSTYPIASDTVFNGRSTRVLGFHSAATEAELRDFFRAQFGKEAVENRVKSDLAIATRTGDYFITVRLHAQAGGYQGTLMLTRIAGKPMGSNAVVNTSRWLPAQSRTISTMQSDDGGQRSITVLAVNEYSMAANRDSVVRAMLEAGFRVEREHTDERRISVDLVSRTETARLIVTNPGPYRSIVLTRLNQSP